MVGSFHLQDVEDVPHLLIHCPFLLPSVFWSQEGLGRCYDESSGELVVWISKLIFSGVANLW